MLRDTAAGISVLSATAVIGKGGGRALGHWSGWLRQAVISKRSAINAWFPALRCCCAGAVTRLCCSQIPTDAYGGCKLRWGSGSCESPAAGRPKGIKFHPSVTVACYATLVCVVCIAYVCD